MEIIGQGFFVEVKENEDYQGPYCALSEARSEAREVGPELKIFHGVLRKNEDKTLNTEELYLVPKTQK